jgi:hypothetical protein
MNRWQWKRLVASMVTVTVLGSAQLVLAQPVTESEYRAARQFMENEQFDEAVRRYRELAQRSNEARAWLALAVATNLSGDPIAGATYVERALSRTSDPWLAQNLEAARGYARQFWPLVGRLVIICEVPGVEVLVDGTRVGTTPLDPRGVVVASGERRVELRSKTHEDQALTIRVAPSDYDVTPEIQETRRTVTLTPRAARMVAHVDVRTNVEGAAIFVDEEYRGSAPLDAPLEVAPGSRRISVRATGYEDGVRIIEAAGHPAGESAAPVEVEIELHEQVIVATTTEGVPNAVRYSILAGGGALVAVAGVTTGLWAAAHTDLDQYCTDGTCDGSSESRDARDRFRTMRITSLVVGGVGVAAIITGLALPRRRTRDVRTDVACDSTGCSAQISGRF